MVTEPFGKITAQILIGTRPSTTWPIELMGYKLDKELESLESSVRSKLLGFGYPEATVNRALTWARETSIGKTLEVVTKTGHPELIPIIFPSLYKDYLSRAETWIQELWRAFTGKPRP
ncbi:MAG: hypothetical protein JRC60_08615 [Deltaproteobacteria bacterium]|nr:hypothetical protein [Deltaproteobacteria bacterium]